MAQAKPKPTTKRKDKGVRRMSRAQLVKEMADLCARLAIHAYAAECVLLTTRPGAHDHGITVLESRVRTAICLQLEMQLGTLRGIEGIACRLCADAVRS